MTKPKLGLADSDGNRTRSIKDIDNFANLRNRKEPPPVYSSLAEAMLTANGSSILAFEPSNIYEKGLTYAE